MEKVYILVDNYSLSTNGLVGWSDGLVWLVWSGLMSDPLLTLSCTQKSGNILFLFSKVRLFSVFYLHIVVSYDILETPLDIKEH
jgi:hypothetical protein